VFLFLISDDLLAQQILNSTQIFMIVMIFTDVSTSISDDLLAQQILNRTLIFMIVMIFADVSFLNQRQSAGTTSFK
jgi:hypothetical protein